MSQTGDEKLKQLIKESIEDIALANALKEGKQTKTVAKAGVLRLLEEK